MWLEGVFVDPAFCMVLVSATLPSTKTGAARWDVYGSSASTEDEAIAWHGTLMHATPASGLGPGEVRWAEQPLAHLTDSSKNVGTCRIVQGAPTGSMIERIEWSDGSVWTRLKVSSVQRYLLTRRPYIPLTVVFLMTVRTIVAHACNVVRGHVRRTWWSSAAV